VPVEGRAKRRALHQEGRLVGWLNRDPDRNTSDPTEKSSRLEESFSTTQGIQSWQDSNKGLGGGKSVDIQESKGSGYAERRA